MKCGPGPQRSALRNWTAYKRTCQRSSLPRMERTLPRVRPRLPIAAAENLCSWPAVAFATGIVIANLVWRPPQVWLIAFGLACAGVLLLYRRAPSLAFLLAMLSLVPLGALYLQVADAAQVTPPNLEAFATGEGTVEVMARVTREGIVRDSPFGGKQESVDVESEELAVGDRRSSAPVGIRLTIYSQRSEEARSARLRGRTAVTGIRLRRAIALPCQTAGTAKLREPRSLGPGGLPSVAGDSAHRLGPLPRGGDSPRIRGFPHRTVAQQRTAQRSESHSAACGRVSPGP